MMRLREAGRDQGRPRGPQLQIREKQQDSNALATY
jgi:hypothetical protein